MGVEPAPAARLGVLLGGTRAGSATSGEVRHFLDRLDLDRDLGGEPLRIRLDFLAHGVAVHPTRTNEAALLEKRGPGGCHVDLVERRVLSRIAPMPGHHFYGHGAFTRAGDVLFAVETDLATDEGVISVRDASTFAPIGTFPTFGRAPHDCQLIEEGRTLVITNGGGPAGTSALASITFVDVVTRRLLERFDVTSPELNAGHVAVARRFRELALVSAPRAGLPETMSGGLSLRLRGRPVTRVTEPAPVTARFVGESLSVCFHEPTRTVVATHPYGDLVTFWNLDARKLVASIDLPHPRGVTPTLDGGHYAISFGAEASLLLLEADPLRQVPGPPAGVRCFGGSHIYAWSHPA